jgi:beta-galactosidase
VTGQPVESRTALLFSWPSWWAQSQPAQPAAELDHLAEARRWYGGTWDAGLAVDLVRPGVDLSAYGLVVVPTVYLLEDEAVAALEAFVSGGGTLVVGCWSGLVDDRDRVPVGRYPGRLRDLLGVTVAEHLPLAAPATVELDGAGHEVEVWSERLVPDAGTEVLGRYSGGELAGEPAVTRHGRVFYVASPLPPAGVRAVLDRAAAVAGVQPVITGLPAGVEAVRRGTSLFLINHTDAPVEVTAGAEVVRLGPWDATVRTAP